MHFEHNSFLSFYRSPFGAQPCAARVRLRLLVGSYAMPTCVRVRIGGVWRTMGYVYSIENSRIFECSCTLPDKPGPVFYSFYAEADGEAAYYTCGGLSGPGFLQKEEPAEGWQITVYEPRKSPAWFQKAVVYQIFPDSFFRGKPTPLKGHFHKAGELPFYKAEQFGGAYLANDTFGGNLWGIAEKIEYIRDLGFNAIYLNPIFTSNTNHGYNTADYEAVDPSLGGTEAFLFLVRRAEKAGIRLILDGVFNHTGSDSRYFNKNGTFPEVGAYQSKASPYAGWYHFSRFPEEYAAWWGFDTLPQTNKEDAGFRRYILTGENAIVKRWLRAGAWGWRLDVADELPEAFLQELYRAVKEENPDAVVLGEVWEDASNKISYGVRRAYFTRPELDGVMNYPLRNAIFDFLLGQTDAYGFYRRVMTLYEHYPKEQLFACLNLLSSHDVPRAATVLGEAPPLEDREQQAAYSLPPEKKQLAARRYLLALCMLVTMPGAPCVYYGDEIGMEGFRDPFCRGGFLWDAPVTEGVAQLLWLRRKEETLATGDLTFCGWGKTSVAYLRGETLLTAINASQAKTEWLPLSLGRDVGAVDLLTGRRFSSDRGVLTLRLEPLGCGVYRLENRWREGDFPPPPNIV